MQCLKLKLSGQLWALGEYTSANKIYKINEHEERETPKNLETNIITVSAQLQELGISVNVFQNSFLSSLGREYLVRKM